MELSDAIENIVIKARALPGIETAPLNPPESVNQYPFVVTYAVRSPDTLRFESQGFGHFFHLIHCEFHLARNILPTAIERALTYIELLPRSIQADQQLGGTVDATRGIDYEFGVLEWGGMENIGVRFMIDVKQKLVEGT